jgi:hypothetical protein
MGNAISGKMAHFPLEGRKTSTRRTPFRGSMHDQALHKGTCSRKNFFRGVFWTAVFYRSFFRKGDFYEKTSGIPGEKRPEGTLARNGTF